MIRREARVRVMRPPLAAFALIACLSLPLARLDAERARRPLRKLPKVELALSGPTTVRAGESLAANRYKVLLTNHSEEPLVLFARNDFLLNAQWSWMVTDSQGSPVGMELFPMMRGFCGTMPYSAESMAAWHRLHDSDVLALNPGESYEFAIPVGPSDDYSFPRAGTYHLSVTLTYTPPKVTTDDGDRWLPRRAYESEDQWGFSQLSPDAFHQLQDSLPVQATSNLWSLQLNSSRRPVGPSSDMAPILIFNAAPPHH